MTEIIKIDEPYISKGIFNVTLYYDVYRVKSNKESIDGAYLFKRDVKLDIEDCIKKLDTGIAISGVSVYPKLSYISREDYISIFLKNIEKRFEREYKLNLLFNE